MPALAGLKRLPRSLPETLIGAGFSRKVTSPEDSSGN
jgi:hypothetical protein